jgi:hypothetical protein
MKTVHRWGLTIRRRLGRCGYRSYHSAAPVAVVYASTPYWRNVSRLVGRLDNIYARPANGRVATTSRFTEVSRAGSCVLAALTLVTLTGVWVPDAGHVDGSLGGLPGRTIRRPGHSRPRSPLGCRAHSWRRTQHLTVTGRHLHAHSQRHAPLSRK